MNQDLVYKISLTLVPGVGPVLARNLIAYCGSPEAVFTERKNHLQKVPGIGATIAEAITSFTRFDRAEKEIDFIQKHNIRALFYLDEEYPARLKEVEDAPVVLYVKGKQNLNVAKVLGVVGTRKATFYGKTVSNQIIAALKPFNVLIISGLALGIDYIAHRAALNNDLPTAAVLGHGLDSIYPGQHRAIAAEIASKGCLITEYLSGTPPDKPNFPERNRIVAGMVDAVLVVETGVKGGALITAELANSYNREVFAIPGRTDDLLSAGCNRLIKHNKACLVENAEDIAYHLGWDISQTNTHDDIAGKIAELSEAELQVYNFLKNNNKTHIDQITSGIGKPVSELSVILLGLEFKGLIHTLPGNFYQSV
ncbi:MAG TPA: DNA-processing protein DprA [Bacteroidia bacterium]|nr:DNA-processing protein DprA [Bacteroidia bacterium]HRS59441.1 DNA-processing protein DprA [Bacteroidia bacterium]HRU68618.1 DNA-processing protein DprA [Bacteroidia bacterium]